MGGRVAATPKRRRWRRLLRAAGAAAALLLLLALLAMAARVGSPQRPPAAEFAPEHRRTQAPGEALLPAAPAAAAGDCPYDFRVYIYDFPDDLPWRAAARELHAAGRRWFAAGAEEEMFSLEVVLHRALRSSCVRTTQPELATYFFVPFYSDIEYRLAHRPAAASKYGRAVLDAMAGNASAWERHFRVTGEYWERSGGWDHIVVMAAPLTSFTHEKSRRGFFHNKKTLASPIVVNIEMLNRFVREYPRCARRNILMPYPSNARSDVEAAAGASALAAAAVSREAAASWPARGGWEALQASWSGLSSDSDVLEMLRLAGKDLFVAANYGMFHGCKHLRKALKADILSEDCPRCAMKTGRQRWRFSGSANATLPASRAEAMRRSLFCPTPAGDSPSAKRMYDVVRLGCIPVVLSDDFLFAFSREAGLGALSEDAFALRVPTAALRDYAQDGRFRLGEASELEVSAPRPPWFGAAASALGPHAGLAAYLRRVPPVRVRELLGNLEAVARDFFNYWSDEDVARIEGEALLASDVDPSGGAVRRFLEALQAQQAAPGAAREACELEMRQRHKDATRFIC